MNTTTDYQGTAAAAAAEPRYGQWRRPKAAGLLGLSTIPTLGALGWILLSFTAMMINPLIGWAVLAVGVLALAPLALKVGDRTLYALALSRIAYSRGRRRRQHQHLNGPLGLMPGGTHRLPGVLAPTRLHHAQDSYAREFALVEHVNTGLYSAVLRCDPEGDQLVDPAQIHNWVAGFAHWLGQLAQLPGVDGAQITVETSPDSGQRLRDEVDRIRTDTAPGLAVQVLTEAAETYPASSAAVDTRVAITWRSQVSAAAKPRSLEDMAVEIGSRLPGISQDLALTGAGSARPMTVEALAECVFTAFNPSEARDLAAARTSTQGTGITWDNAGPSGHAVEHRDRYVHGSGYSIVSTMEQAPRGAVLSNVLRRLLEARDEFDRKRIVLTYSVLDPGASAEIVERDLRHARTAATQRKVMHARDDADVRAAQQTTDEEASGASLVEFGLVATVTVTDADRQRQAAATLDNDAAASRIRLRRAYGAQSATFAVGLGIGLRTNKLATLGGLLENS